MIDQQPLSSDPQAGLSSVAPPPLATDELLRQAKDAAAKGDMESANAAFFQIPADERKARGLYAGPGGADPAASGNAALALGGAGAVASVGRAILSGGSATAGKALAGLKAAAMNPLIKYQATKHMLESVGVPPMVAEPVAMALAGYGKGAKPTATADEGAASGALTAAEEATLVKQGFPKAVIEKIRAGVAKAATPAPSPAVAPRGMSPGGPAPASPAAAAEMPPPVPGPTAPLPSAPAPAAAGQANPKLLASELPEFQRLLKQKKTMKEAMELIEAQRALVQRLGLPTADAARRAVVDRNTSGRWPE